MKVATQSETQFFVDCMAHKKALIFQKESDANDKPDANDKDPKNEGVAPATKPSQVTPESPVKPTETADFGHYEPDPDLLSTYRSTVGPDPKNPNLLPEISGSGEDPNQRGANEEAMEATNLQSFYSTKVPVKDTGGSDDREVNANYAKDEPEIKRPGKKSTSLRLDRTSSESTKSKSISKKKKSRRNRRVGSADSDCKANSRNALPCCKSLERTQSSAKSLLSSRKRIVEYSSYNEDKTQGVEKSEKYFENRSKRSKRGKRKSSEPVLDKTERSEDQEKLETKHAVPPQSDNESSDKTQGSHPKEQNFLDRTQVMSSAEEQDFLDQTQAISPMEKSTSSQNLTSPNTVKR